MRFSHSQVAALCNGIQTSAGFARPRLLQRSLLCQTSVACSPRPRSFFTSNRRLSKDVPSSDTDASEPEPEPKPKPKAEEQPPALQQNSSSTTTTTTSSSSGGSSGSSGNGASGKKRLKAISKVGSSKKKLRDPLRRVASIAQKSPSKPSRASLKDVEAEPDTDYSSTICAICVAESFNMKEVVRVLTEHWYMLDPDGLDFDDEELIHARVRGGEGDFFIFETGTVVTWSLPPKAAVDLATGALLRVAENPHVNVMDREEMTEQLEYQTDPGTAVNSMRGDTVVLGTKRDDSADGDPTDTGRAKIAFSSALARSTKVAVLETLLNTYLEKTEEIPAQLGKGWLKVKRKDILRRTGELLKLRSQLNFFSELTDSLPDKFWDQRAELKLDSIYDQVGKALDVPSRIRVLNQRMDYANDMLTTVREMKDAEHSLRLEWIIILLILSELLSGLYGNFGSSFQNMLSDDDTAPKKT